MKALITGITGFVGSHLADLLLTKDVEIIGLTRWRSPKENILHLLDKVTLVYGDLLDFSSLFQMLEKHRPDVIFHLAAQSLVPYSFTVPAATLDVNILGTCNLLEAARLLRSSKSFDPIIHVCSCYDEKTEVLTNRGFLNYQDIRYDDKVVSIDPVSRRIDYYPIKSIIVQKYKGDMYHITTRSVDLMVTPNHKLLYQSSRGGKLKFGPIVDLEKSSKRYYFAKGRFCRDKTEKFWVGERVYDTRDVFYLAGLYIGDGYSRSQKIVQKNKSGLSRNQFCERRNDKGQFISGRTGLKDTSTYYSHRNFLAIPDGDKARYPAIKCLSHMGINFKLYEQEIFFSSVEWVDFFDEFGHTAETKHIPGWMLEYDVEYLECLYRGLIDSDGHYYATGERYITISPKLSEDFTKLCCFIGKFSTVSIRPSSEVNLKGRIIRSKSSYNFSTSSNSRLAQNKNVNLVSYEGDIWCLEVESVHNFVVRRNGKTHFCGNSSECYGQVQKDEVPIRETNPFRPASPYAVSKVCEDMLAFQYYTSWKMNIIRTRLFTHSGPRRGDVFVVSNFAKQIAKIEQGFQPPVIQVGNLDSIRTFMDVRDAVRAYWMLVNMCPSGEVYNVGGNVTMSIKEMLDKLLRLSSKQIEVSVDPERLRPSDVTLQIPSTDKFRAVTGWEPEIDFDVTLEDTLEYWRAHGRI
ncbi:MAG: GDP-mannose 4,6-dehydratase [Promethearchaeota archaeon]|jgi:GDP-D-mannose dehydratase